MTTPFLIVALGNPGTAYATTRHNAGFMMADFLADTWKLGSFHTQTGLHATCARGKILCNDSAISIIIAKPNTFMNRSGAAVAALLQYYKIPLSHMIVIHDDSDFFVGAVTMQHDRSAAGHNGVQSIIDTCKSKEFARLRIGIRPELSFVDAPRPKASTFVLQDFTGGDRAKFVPALRRAHDLLLHHITQIQNNTAGS